MVLLPLLIWLPGCAEENSSLSDRLSRYTDEGDGCQQVVSAIAYADASLKDMGQEQYQVFDDEVRSKISAVGGTIALEMRDFRSPRTRKQAEVVAKLAERTGSRVSRGSRRIALLREYRREAAEMIIICSREVPGL